MRREGALSIEGPRVAGDDHQGDQRADRAGLDRHTTAGQQPSSTDQRSKCDRRRIDKMSRYLGAEHQLAVVALNGTNKQDCDLAGAASRTGGFG
jgi:hypothetical protein